MEDELEKQGVGRYLVHSIAFSLYAFSFLQGGCIRDITPWLYSLTLSGGFFLILCILKLLCYMVIFFFDVCTFLPVI